MITLKIAAALMAAGLFLSFLATDFGSDIIVGLLVGLFA